MAVVDSGTRREGLRQDVRVREAQRTEVQA